MKRTVLGLDFALDLIVAGTWALAAFFAATRLLSPAAAALLGLAVFITAVSFAVRSRLDDHTMRNLSAGACPHCHAALDTEHTHRRWDPTHSQWLTPLTLWRCPACGFQLSESLICDACPTAA